MGRFTAAPSGSRKSLTLPGRPFSRSYGTILPSSLTRVLPIALVFSTCPPVSVLVRAPGLLPRGFSWRHGFRSFARLRARHPVSGSAPRISLRSTLRGYPRTTSAWVSLAYPVPPSVLALTRWYRNINRLSIAYAFRPRLRSRLTLSRLALLRNPWAFGGGVSHPSFVTRASILTSHASTAGLPPPLRRRGNAPLPLRASSKSVASVLGLSPATLSAPDHLTSELLRTL